MKPPMTYAFSSEEFGKLSQLADILYCLSKMIEEFCLAKQEVEEIAFLTPAIANLRDKADSLNYIFLSAIDSE